MSENDEFFLYEFEREYSEKKEEYVTSHYCEASIHKTTEIRNEKDLFCKTELNVKKNGLIEEYKETQVILKEKLKKATGEFQEQIESKQKITKGITIKDLICSFTSNFLFYCCLFICICLLYYPQHEAGALMALAVLGFGMPFSLLISLGVHLVSLKITKSVYKELKCKPGFNLWTSLGFFTALLFLLLYFLAQDKEINISHINFLNQPSNHFAISRVSVFLTISLLIIWSFFISRFVSKAKEVNKVEKVFHNIPILNFEYYMSLKFKSCFIEQLPSLAQKYKGAIVRYTNTVNLIVSIVMCMLFFFVSPSIQQNFDNNSMPFWVILSCVIFTRAIGRSMEIMYAFFNDVMDRNNKTTDIDAFERIRLAISSLIEITFLFAPLYLTYDRIIENSEFKHNISALFHSFGITTYKGIDFKEAGRTVAIVMILHVLTSMVLMVFTFARYIGEMKIKDK